MAAPAVDSKSAKKRKNKVADLNATETSSHASEPTPAAPTNGTDTPTESPYIKELNKQIRNATKKLSASSKTEAIIAENPGKTLDQLVSEKKINNDQKAQIENKPAIKAQLAQYEEQIANYRSFAQEHEDRFSREKATLIESHDAEIAQLKEEAATSAKAAEGKDLDNALKVISSFLHAAAAKRTSEDPDSDEARAFEGGLLLVYQGNSTSVDALRNLVQGNDEKLIDTMGEPLDFTYAQLKDAALSAKAEAEVEDEAPVPEEAAITDPTIAHAGLTELEETSVIPIHTNGLSEAEPASAAPEQASTGDDAANAVAESSWDPAASAHTDASAAGGDWVEVPRDPAETETGLQATPAAPAAQAENSNSWAEEVSEAPETKPIPENDGFEQVKGRHSDGRGRGGRGPRGGRGDGFRGRGRGGGGRGGDGRGRGRGDGTRGRGGHRGERSG